MDLDYLQLKTILSFIWRGLPDLNGIEYTLTPSKQVKYQAILDSIREFIKD